jgi:hypothetical protein
MTAMKALVDEVKSLRDAAKLLNSKLDTIITSMDECPVKCGECLNGKLPPSQCCKNKKIQ